MGARNHNKKRNVGLLYEFLVRHISTALVERNTAAQSAALRVIKRHFRPGSELLKELRLVRALVRTTVSSPAVATSIINEAKNAARTLDHARLDEEKTMLLRSIARVIRDDSFFVTQVDEYRAYATVQTLVNEWRDPRGADLSRLAQYEDELTRMLTSERTVTDDRFVNGESPGTNRLLAHIMTKRLNEKYSHTMDPAQRDLVRAYVFAAAKCDPAALRQRLETARKAVLESLDTFESERHGDGSIETLEKIRILRENLVRENLENVDDDLIARFLSCMRVRSEIDGSASALVEVASLGALSEGIEPRLLISSPEYVEHPAEMVKESRVANGGRIILSGILQKADTLNQNGRVYPRAILEREIRNYQKFINERRSTGELDHPDSSVISLKNVSHKVIEAVMDGNVVRGKVELLNTPSGKILQDLLEGDVKLGISSRGVGSTRKQGEYVVVQEDFQLICWDFVSEPSTPGAFMLPEGRRIAEGKVLTRVERVDRLLSELLVR